MVLVLFMAFLLGVSIPFRQGMRGKSKRDVIEEKLTDGGVSIPFRQGMRGKCGYRSERCTLFERVSIPFRQGMRGK